MQYATIESRTGRARSEWLGIPHRAVIDVLAPRCSDPAAAGARLEFLPAEVVDSVPNLPPEVREGEILAGKYRIEAVIGGGAMGTVVAAHHLGFDQKVAIKFLAPDALGHSEAVPRFLREARTLLKFQSEHVVRVLDVALLESGNPYIVMEYLEGCDLAKWLERYGVLPLEQAVDFIIQACDGVAEAHRLRIIHRDLKPANLFVVRRVGRPESVKVVDFGISKVEGLVSRTIPPGDFKPGSVVTQDRMLMGSPMYMSPEQMESARDVDERTDIWSLGVTLWELVTGRLPYEGRSLLQVYSNIASQAPPRLREANRQLPRGFETVVRKCLERDRERRYRSVVDLAMALVLFGSSRSRTCVQLLVREDAAQKSAAEATASASPSSPKLASGTVEKTLPSAAPPPLDRAAVTRESVTRSARRRPGVTIGLLATVVLVVGVVLSQWSARNHRSSTSAVMSSVTSSPPLPVESATAVSTPSPAPDDRELPHAVYGSATRHWEALEPAASLQVASASSRPLILLSSIPSRAGRQPPVSATAAPSAPIRQAVPDASAAAVLPTVPWQPPATPK